MPKRDEEKAGSAQSFESLLRLLPSLIAAMPAFMNMLGENGERRDLGQLISAIPEMIEKLKETDDESLQNLYSRLTEVLPGIEEILPSRRGE